MEHTYEISGMHCAGCGQKIAKALEGLDGINSAAVTINPPEATVVMSKHIQLTEMNAALGKVGDYLLVEKSVPGTTAASMPTEVPETLRPLVIILGYLIGGVLLRSVLSGDFSIYILMGNFMGGFFITFSLFKMIDVPGFADGYATYDLIAKRSRTYALAYPFIELGIGVAYLFSFALLITNILTLLLMLVGAWGVAVALRKKQIIRCACLGTALKLPMTKVTLIEDLGMGMMALLMLMLAM